MAKNSLRVWYKGAFYQIADLSKEMQELMRPEIDKAVKAEAERKKWSEPKEQPKAKIKEGK